jgi:pyridoxine 5-phosphate synthase
LYTESYARAFATEDECSELSRFAIAAEKANEIGLGVNAGHDLNLQNLPAFCAAVPGVLEVSIGHALIAYSLEVGLQHAVRDYLRALPCTAFVGRSSKAVRCRSTETRKPSS